MVVRSVQLLVELNHQALEERRKFLLLLARLKTKGDTKCEQAAQQFGKSVCPRLCVCVRVWPHCSALTTFGAGRGGWGAKGGCKTTRGKTSSPPHSTLSADSFTT